MLDLFSDITCPLIPLVHSCHLSTHTTCPLIPLVHSHHLSTHATCPLIPLVHSCHLSTHTTCPLTSLVHSCHLPTHTTCPLTPLVSRSVRPPAQFISSRSILQARCLSTRSICHFHRPRCMDVMGTFNNAVLTKYKGGQKL